MPVPDELDLALDLMWMALNLFCTRRDAMERTNPYRSDWKRVSADYVAAADSLVLHWHRLRRSVVTVVKDRLQNPRGPFQEGDKQGGQETQPQAPAPQQQGLVSEGAGSPPTEGLQQDGVQERVDGDDGTAQR
jgi:hypothetical protein